VEGENTEHDQRPKEHRKPDGRSGNRSDADSGSKDRNRNRRTGSGGGSGGGRRGVYRYDDQMDHAICLLVTHKVPKAFPVMARSELATMPQVEVARTGSSVLLCDKQHDGPHLWPNGDEVL
jgi:hypothetical protein